LQNSTKVADQRQIPETAHVRWAQISRCLRHRKEAPQVSEI